VVFAHSCGIDFAPFWFTPAVGLSPVAGISAVTALSLAAFLLKPVAAFF